jgi:hypothetical protein
MANQMHQHKFCKESFWNKLTRLAFIQIFFSKLDIKITEISRNFKNYYRFWENL